MTAALRLSDHKPHHNTVAELVAIFLRGVKRRAQDGNLSLAAAENYDRDLSVFCVDFGAQLIADCRQHDLTEWLHKHPEWKSTHTKRRCISSVVVCFRWAEEEQLIARCPYRYPQCLRGLPAESRKPATRADFQALMKGASVPLRWALVFLFRTGCRTKEMRDLRWDQVFLDHEIPHILMTEHKTAKKTGKPRIVILTPAVLKLLLWIKRTSRSEFVFTNSNGTPWRKDSFCHCFCRAARRVGLNDDQARKITAYGFRHGYITDAVAANNPELGVAFVAGHADATMVAKIYASSLRHRLPFLDRISKRIDETRE